MAYIQKNSPLKQDAKFNTTQYNYIKKAGDFLKSSVTKGFKSYMGTKGIHLTSANANGIQSPGLTGKAKTDSTYNANYKKWVGKADPMVATKGDYNYMLKQKKKKK